MASKRKVEVTLTATDRFTAPFRAMEMRLARLRRSSGLLALSAQADATGAAFSRLGMRMRPFLAGGALVAGGGLALGVTALKGFVDQASELDDASKRLGVGVEALQRLQYAAEQTGAPFESLSSGLRIFSKNVGLAGMGSKAQVAAFKGLGISLRGPNGEKGIDELLADVAGKFERITSHTKRAAIGQRLFGRGAAELLPLLSLGRAGLEDLLKEADRLGLVMGRDAVTAGDDFGDALQRTERIIGSLRNTMGFRLVQSFEGPLARFEEWWSAVDNQRAAQRRLTDAIDATVASGSRFVDWSESSGIPAVEKFVDRVGGWENALTGIGVAIGASLVAPTALVVIELTKLGVLLAASPAGWAAFAAAGGLAAGRVLSRWAPFMEMIAYIEKMPDAKINLLGPAGHGLRAIRALTGPSRRVGDEIGKFVVPPVALASNLPRGFDKGPDIPYLNAGAPSPWPSSPAPTAAAQGGAAPQDLQQLGSILSKIGGTVKIIVEDQRIRLREMTKTGPVEFDFYAGPAMSPAGG